MDTFAFVMRSLGEPTVAAADMDRRLVKRAVPLRR